jgi:damage-control phosphatase, subfamily I
MRAYPDCFTCLLRQALEASQEAGAGEPQQYEIIRRVLEVLQEADPGLSPSEISNSTNRIVGEVTGVADPYQAYKEASTQQALEMYPRLKQVIAAAADPLEAAVRLSIAGNIIDAVHTNQHDLEATVERALTQDLAGSGLAAFHAALAGAARVLYLADNAGETVFDRLLIEQMGKPVIYAVKSAPILNDATYAEALAVGLDRVATLMPTGSGCPGTVLSLCTPEFRQIFASADLIISKGQANYETLSNQDGRVFFLLQIKCAVLGRDIGCPFGSMVAMQAGQLTERGNGTARDT